MNIWLINHYALPTTSSGITRTFDFATRLGRRGHDVTVFASSFDHYSRRDRRVGSADQVAVETVDGVRAVWLRTPPYSASSVGRIRNMVAFARQLLRHAADAGAPAPDVVLGSSPHLLTPWAAQRLAARLGVPFVMEVRDIWPSSLVELGGPPPWHPAVIVLRRIERRLYRTSSRIVTLLPGAADHIARSGGDERIVRWVPNGADARVAATEIPPLDDVLEIVYAGTFGHANELRVVVEAAALLEQRPAQRTVRWRLVGQGPDATALHALVAALGVTTVTIEAPVAKEDVPAVLATAHACVLHLRDAPVFRWGISPNKLFDYFAAARPVLMAVNTPFDPVAEAGAGISVPAGDPAALAGGARRMAALDREQLAALGRAGRCYLVERHDLDALAVSLASVLEEAALLREPQDHRR